MKEIMISIRPEWVEKILSGYKTIEIRKNKPNCELPCKVYIYCTKSDDYIYYARGWKQHFTDHSKVVGEFVLNNVEEFSCGYATSKSMYYGFNGYSCLTFGEIKKYVESGTRKGLGDTNGKTGFAWHIEDLKIYDKPKELSEFKTACKNNYDVKKCEGCSYFHEESNESVGYHCECTCDGLKDLKRAPQSWQYVETLKGVDRYE